MSEGQQIAHPDWKPGKFRALTTEGLQINLNIIVSRLKQLLRGPRKNIDSAEIYRLSNSLSGLIRAGLALEDREQERAAMLEQIRQEFALIARQEFSKHPDLLTEIEKITSTIRLSGE